MDWGTARANLTRIVGAILLAFSGAAIAQSTAITRVSVIDVASGKVAANQTVIVKDRMIASVGPAARVKIPADTRIVDGRGRYLIPGLWDMGSFALNEASEVPGSMELLVAHGVTGIRNLRTGRKPPEIKQLVADIASGRAVGPKIIWSTNALSRSLGEPVPANSVDVQAASDLVAAIDGAADAGAHFIFIGPRLPEAHIPLAVATADRRKLPVSAWVVHGWKQTAEAGVDDIYHFVDLYRSTAIKPDRDIYLRTARDVDFRRSFVPNTNAFYAFMEPLRKRRDEAYYRETISAVARTQTPVTTNMATMFWAQQANAALIAERARFAKLRKNPPPPPPPTAVEDNSRNGLWSDLQDLHAAGVVLMTGTSSYGVAEALPGATLHDELEILVQTGFTPRQALQMATINPGQVVNRLYPRVSASMGIAAGQPADLVLLDANPLEDIRAIRQVHTVVADGRYFGPAERAALLATAEKLASSS